VLGSGAVGARRALLLREWSETVTLYANGPSRLEDADAKQLVVAGVVVDERPVVELLGPNCELAAVRFADGTASECQGLLIPVVLKQRSRPAETLGVALAEPPAVAVARPPGHPVGFPA